MSTFMAAQIHTPCKYRVHMVVSKCVIATSFNCLIWSKSIHWCR